MYEGANHGFHNGMALRYDDLEADTGFLQRVLQDLRTVIAG